MNENAADTSTPEVTNEVVEVGKLIASVQVLCLAGGHALSAPSGLCIAAGFHQTSPLALEQDAGSPDFTNVLSEVMKLTPKTYQDVDGGSDQRRIGLATNEAPQTFLSDDGSAIDLSAVIAGLVVVLQEQQRTIDMLKLQVAGQKQRD